MSFSPQTKNQRAELFTSLDETHAYLVWALAVIKTVLTPEQFKNQAESYQLAMNVVSRGSRLLENKP